MASKRIMLDKRSSSRFRDQATEKEKETSVWGELHQGSEKKLSETVARVEEVKKKTKLVEKNALRAIDDYKKLAIFKEEMTESSSYTYEYGFNNWKAKVAKLFSDPNLIKVIILEENVG